jgi:hypothetical protein
VDCTTVRFRARRPPGGTLDQSLPEDLTRTTSRFPLNPSVINKMPPTATMGVNPFALIGGFARAVQRLLRPVRSSAKVAIGAARDLTRT